MHRNVTASRNKTAEKRVSSKGRAPTAPTKSLFHEVHGVPVNPGQCVAFSMQLPAVQGSPIPAPPLPARALKQNPSIPGTAMFTTSIFLGWPQPSQSIVGPPNKSECFLQHEPGLKAERLWSQLLAQQFMEAVRQRLSSPFNPIPILPKKHNPPLIAMPVQCCYCTRGTKWPKKISWLKCSIMLTLLYKLDHGSKKNNTHYWAAYWDFSALPRSCQEKEKCYSSSMHGYDRLFPALKIRLEKNTFNFKLCSQSCFWSIQIELTG